jgi:two-component system chemotaxis sensor kinase CheA
MSDADEFLPQLRATFQVEALEHQQTLSEGLALLAQRPGAGHGREEVDVAAVIERVFRAAHSLKGAARAVGFAHVEVLCEAMEDVLAAWRAGVRPERAAVVAMQRAADAMAGLLGALPAPAAAELAAAQAARRMLTQLTRPGAPAPRAGPAHPAASAPHPAASASPPNAAASPQYASAFPSSESQAPEPASAATSAARDQAERSPQSQPSAPAPFNGGPSGGTPLNGASLAAAPRRTSVRVSTTALEAQLLQAEELLAAKAAARQRATELAEMADEMRQLRRRWTDPSLDPRLRPFADEAADALRGLQARADASLAAAGADRHAVGKLVDDLLDHAKSLLLLPFSTICAPFPRLVRDLCGELGKDAELRIEGDDVKLDKHVLEEIKDPLIHLLRNAVDHGVEAPAVRLAAGKGRTGSLHLSVRRAEGNKVWIRLADDGCGIDVAAVAAAAQRKGLVSAEQLAGMDDAQRRALIFRSAVSSSLRVTRVSGRGLGLAIVREKVEALGGEVTVDSSSAAGTCFALLLPVTRSTFRGILVEARGQTLVVPTAQVERVGRARPDQLHQVEGRDTLALDGRVIPLANLADVLELPPGVAPSAATQVRAGATPAAANPHAAYLVIGTSERRLALTVDAVTGEEEVLVKPLRKPLVRVRNVAGATILATGAIAPVLDVQDLLRSAARHRAAAAVPAGSVPAAAQPVAPRVLVAEDSITSRMLLQAILESAGYRVSTAVDGADAWERLQGGGFDLLVSDIEMPRLDGIGLTQRIRSDAALAALPVVLVTTLASPQDRERGASAGANAYIVKGGFDQGDLLGSVRRLLGV